MIRFAAASLLVVMYYAYSWWKFRQILAVIGTDSKFFPDKYKETPSWMKKRHEIRQRWLPRFMYFIGYALLFGPILFFLGALVIVIMGYSRQLIYDIAEMYIGMDLIKSIYMLVLARIYVGSWKNFFDDQRRRRRVMEKGEVYWYKYSKKIYCFTVLEVITTEDYLIAISEEIEGCAEEPSLEEAISADLYTVAWFNKYTLLSSRRTHVISEVDIVDDYTNRAGIWIDDDEYINQNPGGRGVWRHEYRLYAMGDLKIRDTFDTRYIPKTFVQEE